MSVLNSSEFDIPQREHAKILLTFESDDQVVIAESLGECVRHEFAESFGVSQKN